MRRQLLLFISIVVPLLSVPVARALAQSHNLSGTVTAEDTGPLPGVTVKIIGTTTGTTTDADGHYSLSVTSGSQLEFSSIGYQTQIVSVGDQNTLDILLKVNANQLGETVVTALGIKRERRSLGYATSTIKGDELTKSGQTLNPFLSLYGKAAGVGVNIGAGGPEGGIKLNVRGAASMNPSENVRPLIVIDGVIMSDRTTSISGLNGFDYGAGINDINSEDIESIEILKGAKATVLYGTDAANGVVLITTKSGAHTRGLGMTASFQHTIEQPVSYIDFQNEYGLGNSIYDTSYTTIGGNRVRQIPLVRWNYGPKFDGSDIMFWDSSMVKNSAHPDNYSSLFQNGYSNTANVAIAGSNEMGNLRASYTNYSYQDITGPSSSQQRNTFSFNGNIKASDLASFQVVSNIYSITSKNRRHGNPGMIAWGMPRDYDYGLIFPLYTDETGYKRDLSLYGVTNAITEAGTFLWEQQKNNYKDDKLHMVTSVKATLNFTKHVFLTTQAGFDYTTTDFENDISVNRILPQIEGGGFSVAKEKSIVQTYQALLNYDGSFFNKDLHLFAFAGGIYRGSKFDHLGSNTAGGLNYPDWYSFANERGPITAGNAYLLRNYNRTSDVLYSALGSATLSWKSEIYLELQARKDWNSTLPPKNNAYFYPGASLTWNYTERFPIANMNFGQLRLSWANVGSGTVPYYAVNAYGFGIVSGTTAISISPPSAILPDELLPERKREFEVGINNGFFKGNRLVVDFSFYTNNRYNQIIGLPLSSATSSTELRINAGNVKNWGFELALSGSPVASRSVRWDVSLTAAAQHSKVIDLYPGITKYNFNNLFKGVAISADEGSPYGEIKMYDYTRDSMGNRIVSSSGLYSLDQQRFVPIGRNIMPDVYGGLLSDVYFKGFDFRVGFDYKFGGTIFSITNNYLTGNGQLESTLKYRDEAHGGLAYYVDDATGALVQWEHDKPAPAEARDGKVYHDGLILDGVKEVTGTDGKTTYVKNDIITSASDYYLTYINDTYQFWPPDHVFKNDYIKVRELSLGYTFPEAITSKLKLQRLTLTLAARNLFYLYKTVPNLDVESALGADSYVENTVYPSIRSYSFGINVSF